MRKFLSDKDSNFEVTHVREEESDGKNVKRDTRYTWKTLKGMKNHSLSKNGMFLLCSDLYYVRKRCHTCTIRMFFPKERPYFLHSYLINFLLSSPNIYLGSYPKIQLHVPLII